MRAAISHFISSFVSKSLTINSKALLLRFDYLLLASPAFPWLLAAKVNTNPNEPESPIPHRGSGRKESVQYFIDILAAV
jgi:hypothetical protein